ncbi:MAG: methyltransferase domain-containing protein [Chloroflexi bacterium]|nr:methyltransferase domain-containing protein [Chloroflexota bacterium]
MPKRDSARHIFGARAATYTYSATHTDPVVLGHVVALAQAQRSWLALDIGTGTGHTAFAVAPHVAYVLGIDFTPQMLAEGEALRAQKGLTNVFFTVADAHALPIASATVDLVTCRRAAHHFTDLPQALAEMRRALRPGGRLVIDDRSVPEEDWPDTAMNYLDTLHDPSHVREYRASEWVSLLEAAGLRVEAVEPYLQHRPLASSLVERAAPKDARAIYAFLEGLEEAQRQALGVREVNGELYINHWYAMLAAVAE